MVNLLSNKIVTHPRTDLTGYWTLAKAKDLSGLN